VIDYKIKKAEPVIDNQVYIIVEDMPEFPGGILEFRKWVKSNLKYPESARKKKIMGKVYIGFVINKEGKVEGGRVLRSIDPFLDAEALRVVSSMPNSKPGKQKGIPVKVSFSFPITFHLHL
jgi:protein TonB